MAQNRLAALPDDFDIDLIGDDSRLPADVLAALRELAFRKASRDPIWFLENFWHVIDPEKMEWVKFKLRPYQREDAVWFLDGMGKKRWRAVVLKARQIGWTTLAVALVLWDMLFHKNHPWLIVSQGESEAQGTLLERAKEPYNRLPLWFRDRAPSLGNDNMESMTFDNGSSLLSIPATGRAGRSKTVFGVLFDEKAWADKADELDTALDPLCYGPKVDFSTANGMGNAFHKTWVEAQRFDSEFASRFRPWDVVPGRDETWYEREKRKFRGREWEFYQEYPSTPEEAFAKTGRTALPIQLLREEQDWRQPEVRLNLDLGWEPLTEGEEADNELWVWELPTVERDEKGRTVRAPNYVVFADVSEGLAHGDRTSITVFNANTFEEAAAYRGYWPIEDLADLLNQLGKFYYYALMLVERNNQGLLPIDRLRRDHHYPRLFRMPQIAQIPSERTARYGWLTNRATKPKMIHEFVKGLRDGHVVLHDPRFLEEAITFISDGKGGFAASDGNHDDHVISHLGAWQGCLEVGQYPTVWHDDTERRVTFRDIMELADLAELPKVDALAQAGVRSQGRPNSWVF